MATPIAPVELLKTSFRHLRQHRIVRHFDRTHVKKPGSPPGTLVHVGEKKTERTRITLIDYDATHCDEKIVPTLDACFPFRDTASTTWLNIDGLHDTALIEQLGAHFRLHPLIQEDILNTQQRPKLEEFEEYLFIVAKMLTYDEARHVVVPEQVSIVLGKNLVISFQERSGDVFDSVRLRIRTGKGKMRKGGADYLTYALLDAVVDHYYVILEKLGEQTETLEEALSVSPSTQHLVILHHLKREMIFLRRSIWPLREVIGGLQRSDSRLIKASAKVYIRDVYDHTVQVLDTMETLRDMLSGMVDLYLSSTSNRMNEIMKVLTIFAAIFIPLTLVAGIYGMNFQHMPELSWRYGYFYVLGLMLIIGAGMLAYFRKKGWF